MSSGIETAALIEPWIYSRLSGDTALAALVDGRIYGALTPDEIDGVYVTLALLSVRDVRGVGVARFQVDALYLVKAVGETTSQDDLLPVAERIDAVLDGVANAAFNGGQITCMRENTISYPEVTGGQAFLHLGSQFRIRANS